MQLTITNKAKEALKNINDENRPYLLLWYDTDGCGCGVNGLPTIRFITEKRNTHRKVDNELFSTLINEQQAIFFAEKMTLDFSNGTFRLSSPEQILNPFISTQSVMQPLMSM